MLPACLAWMAGLALQLGQAQLWAPAFYAALTVPALVLVAAAMGLRLSAMQRRALGHRGQSTWVLLCLLCGLMLLAFGSTGWRASMRLADALPPELQGRDILVTGRVAGLPRPTEVGVRLLFEVATAQLDGRPVQVPRLIALSWIDPQRARHARRDGPLGKAAVPLTQEPRAGERWQWTVRLRRPHGLLNPHGFDQELWWFERGIRATGYVRPDPPQRTPASPDAVAQGGEMAAAAQGGETAAAAQRLAAAPAWSLHAARERVRDAIRARLPDPAVAGVVAALTIGDQAAIEREGWDVFRATGTAHLVVISGLHVTLFAWMAGGLCGWLWRRSARATLACPAPTAARWGGLAAALGFAVFSGWGLPAQRTVWMLATVTALAAIGVRWSALRTLALAALVVSAVDPWAVLQPGFWLSFVAVGWLFVAAQRVRSADVARPASDVARSGAGEVHGWHHQAVALLSVHLQAAGRRAGRWLYEGGRAQWATGLGLAPLTMLFFHQVSVVGFMANAVAIPLVTLLITPLALAGVLWGPLWSPAGWLTDRLVALLGWMADWPGAVWAGPALPAWAFAAGCLGTALCLLPLPWRCRVLALPLWLPLLWPAVPRPPHGQFELIVADVGQGGAAIVRTAHRTVVVDAGPAYGSGGNAGERVLLPLLRALGDRPDLIVLTHRDTDHVGGAAALLANWPQATVLGTLEPGHDLRRERPGYGAPDWPPDTLGEGNVGRWPYAACVAGLTWNWDGVRFTVLHPPADVRLPAPRANAVSCVLRIDGQRGSALLPGDIERAQELALVAAAPQALRADVLLAPHHGSRSSSHPLFIEAVQPQVVVFQTGHLNAFGHPAPEVVARYTAANARLVATPACGAWRWAGEGPGRCEREHRRRYWRSCAALSPKEPP